MWNISDCELEVHTVHLSLPLSTQRTLPPDDLAGVEVERGVGVEVERGVGAVAGIDVGGD